MEHHALLNIDLLHDTQYHSIPDDDTPQDDSTTRSITRTTMNKAASSNSNTPDQNAAQEPAVIQKQSKAEELDDTQFQFSLKIYACVYPWVPWKVAGQLWSWEREHGVVDIYDVEEEQTVIPTRAWYLLVGERALYDPYGNIILLCQNISEENVYVKGVTKLLPVTAIFHEIVNSRTDFPSLLEHMDDMCMQNILQEEEKLTVRLPEQRDRFQEMYDLFETVVRGEKLRGRKLRWVTASVKRWSANVERYFLTEAGEGNEENGNEKEFKAGGNDKNGEAQRKKKK